VKIYKGENNMENEGFYVTINGQDVYVPPIDLSDVNDIARIWAEINSSDWLRDWNLLWYILQGLGGETISYLGSVDILTDLPGTVADARNLWNLDSDPIPNDFAFVQQDSTHGGHTASYAIGKIDNGNITWKFQYAIDIEIADFDRLFATDIYDNSVKGGKVVSITGNSEGVYIVVLANTDGSVISIATGNYDFEQDKTNYIITLVDLENKNNIFITTETDLHIEDIIDYRKAVKKIEIPPLTVDKITNGNGISLNPDEGQGEVRITNTLPNIQSDWNADPSSTAYVLNRPDVNNPTITFHQEGIETDQTITLNQAVNKTISFLNSGGGSGIDNIVIIASDANLPLPYTPKNLLYITSDNHKIWQNTSVNTPNEWVQLNAGTSGGADLDKVVSVNYSSGGFELILKGNTVSEYKVIINTDNEIITGQYNTTVDKTYYLKQFENVNDEYAFGVFSASLIDPDYKDLIKWWEFRKNSDTDYEGFVFTDNNNIRVIMKNDHTEAVRLGAVDKNNNIIITTGVYNTVIIGRTTFTTPYDKDKFYVLTSQFEGNVFQDSLAFAWMEEFPNTHNGYEPDNTTINLNSSNELQTKLSPDSNNKIEITPLGLFVGEIPENDLHWIEEGTMLNSVKFTISENPTYETMGSISAIENSQPIFDIVAGTAGTTLIKVDNRENDAMVEYILYDSENTPKWRDTNITTDRFTYNAPTHLLTLHQKVIINAIDTVLPELVGTFTGSISNGVQQLMAGKDISLDPSDGTGIVTITNNVITNDYLGAFLIPSDNNRDFEAIIFKNDHSNLWISTLDKNFNILSSTNGEYFPDNNITQFGDQVGEDTPPYLFYITENQLVNESDLDYNKVVCIIPVMNKNTGGGSDFDKVVMVTLNNRDFEVLLLGDTSTKYSIDYESEMESGAVTGTYVSNENVTRYIHNFSEKPDVYTVNIRDFVAVEGVYYKSYRFEGDEYSFLIDSQSLNWIDNKGDEELAVKINTDPDNVLTKTPTGLKATGGGGTSYNTDQFLALYDSASSVTATKTDGDKLKLDGGTSDDIIKESLTDQIDGVKNTFVVSTPITEVLGLYYNGILEDESFYRVDGQNITLDTTIPQVGEKLVVWIYTSGGPGPSPGNLVFEPFHCYDSTYGKITEQNNYYIPFTKEGKEWYLAFVDVYFTKTTTSNIFGGLIRVPDYLAPINTFPVTVRKTSYDNGDEYNLNINKEGEIKETESVQLDPHHGLYDIFNIQCSYITKEKDAPLIIQPLHFTFQHETGATSNAYVILHGTADKIMYSYEKIDWYETDVEELIYLPLGSDEVYIVGVNYSSSTVESEHSGFDFNYVQDINVEGNLGSLINPYFPNSTDLLPNHFRNLFYHYDSGNTKGNDIKDASKLKLPWTTLTENCFESMFENSPIQFDPVLPAITLAPYCYRRMYYNSRIPASTNLPATNLAPYCYASMFENSDIIYATTLFASELVDGCYHRMFYNCYYLTPIISMLFGAFDTVKDDSLVEMFSADKLITGRTNMTPKKINGDLLWLGNDNALVAKNCFLNNDNLTDYDTIPYLWGGPNHTPWITLRVKNPSPLPDTLGSIFLPNYYYNNFPLEYSIGSNPFNWKQVDGVRSNGGELNDAAANMLIHNIVFDTSIIHKTDYPNGTYWYVFTQTDNLGLQIQVTIDNNKIQKIYAEMTNGQTLIFDQDLYVSDTGFIPDYKQGNNYFSWDYIKHIITFKMDFHTWSHEFIDGIATIENVADVTGPSIPMPEDMYFPRDIYIRAKHFDNNISPVFEPRGFVELDGLQITEVLGDLANLIDYTDTRHAELTPYCFKNLFNHLENLELADRLIFSWDNLAEGCFDSMFHTTPLHKLPKEILAKGLASGCFRSMFRDLYELTTLDITFGNFIGNIPPETFNYTFSNGTGIDNHIGEIPKKSNGRYLWEGNDSCEGDYANVGVGCFDGNIKLNKYFDVPHCWGGLNYLYELHDIELGHIVSEILFTAVDPPIYPTYNQEIIAFDNYINFGWKLSILGDGELLGYAISDINGTKNMEVIYTVHDGWRTTDIHGTYFNYDNLTHLITIKDPLPVTTIADPKVIKYTGKFNTMNSPNLTDIPPITNIKTIILDITAASDWDNLTFNGSLSLYGWSDDDKETFTLEIERKTPEVFAIVAESTGSSSWIKPIYDSETGTWFEDDLDNDLVHYNHLVHTFTLKRENSIQPNSTFSEDSLGIYKTSDVKNLINLGLGANLKTIDLNAGATSYWDNLTFNGSFTLQPKNKDYPYDLFELIVQRLTDTTFKLVSVSIVENPSWIETIYDSETNTWFGSDLDDANVHYDHIKHSFTFKKENTIIEFPTAFTEDDIGFYTEFDGD
jgi:hypothetical protein